MEYFLKSKIRKCAIAIFNIKVEYSLIDKIKKFAKEAKGEATLYGWVLCAQYSNHNLMLDEALAALLAKVDMLHFFSPLLIPSQSENSATILSKKPLPCYDEESEDAAYEVLINDVKTPYAYNKIDKMFDFINQGVAHTSSSMQHAAFIMVFDVSDKIDKIWDVIRRNLIDGSDALYGPTMRTLSIFIKRVKTPDKIDEIFDILKKSLKNDAKDHQKVGTLYTLTAFIRTLSISDKADEILGLIIEKGLKHNSIYVQEEAQEALIAFMMTLAASNKAREIFDLMIKSLEHDLSLLQETILKVLTAFLIISPNEAQKIVLESLIACMVGSAFSSKTDPVFDFIVKGLTHNLERIQQGALDALIAFIGTPMALNKVDEIFGLIKTNLIHDSKKMQKGALDALTIYLKKEVPMTLDMWKEGLAYVWQMLLKMPNDFKIDGLQEASRSAFTALIKYCPSMMIDHKADITEAEKVSYFWYSLAPLSQAKDQNNDMAIEKSLAQKMRI